MEQQQSAFEKEKADELERHQQALDQLNREVETLRAATIDPKDLEIRFSAEKAVLETQILQIKQKLIELHKRNDELAFENKDLRNQIRKKDEEIEAQKAEENRFVAGRSNELDELRKQLDHFKRLHRVTYLQRNAI